LPERIEGGVAGTQNRLAPGCRAAAENLSGYLEDDLPCSRRRLVARHLRRCIDCRALLDSLAWTICQLRALGRAEVASPSVAETVVERIGDDRAQLLQ
jgi:predicted anti-sigma-YlaC factor YlaD